MVEVQFILEGKSYSVKTIEITTSDNISDKYKRMQDKLGCYIVVNCKVNKCNFLAHIKLLHKYTWASGAIESDIFTIDRNGNDIDVALSLSMDNIIDKILRLISQFDISSALQVDSKYRERDEKNAKHNAKLVRGKVKGKYTGDKKC